MHKIINILIFFGLSAPIVSSQIITPNSQNFIPINKSDTIEKANLCIIYNQILQLDSTNKEKVEASQMILQIGNKISKYSNYKRLLNDSIKKEQAIDNKLYTEGIKAAIERMRGAGDLSETFKNYPTNHKYMYRKSIGGVLSYQEETQLFKWEISDETIDILGYSCQKAITTFRGRTYTAWFAPNIPISNGPWKFGGLPGLILKVEDSKKQFCFEAVSIYKPSWNMFITYNIRKNEIKTTREKFNIAERRYKEDPITILKNKGLIDSDYNSQKSLPYNPIELY